ncbi:Nicotinate dehydrogenase subunit B [Aquicella siphonis]|uniref:Nicotinate dehydrogenase subunit B n=1 Tax=Aquicella siphonis TaxID=254247 RepID=A0A5E4PG16_9COXI|nr:c-type cytochrome [Aquicella siphonis]VVC75575.1 Nicotinate dehydrogenase subunit B [Aquicella siphonis]
MRKMMEWIRRNRKFIYFVVFFFLLVILIQTINNIVINARLAANSYVSTGHFPAYPQADLKNKTKEQIARIKRGEFLVKAGDCIACHTLTTGSGARAAFTGGLPMQTPFGVIYSPNITPDKETGIGNWTDDQFITAMREGVSPQGFYYYPAFPYLYFNKITTPDLLAIKAYLDAIPAVRQENRKNDMIWPFNWRFLQLGWRILFFYPQRSGPYQTDPARSAAWNEGAYLVQGPGHCAMCHTPSYYLLSPAVSLGAPIKKYDLTGANIEGYLAPNITKSNLGGIPDNQLLDIFTQYRLLGGSPIQGPMYEAIHDSLIQLPTQSLLSMLQYLKTVESELPPPSGIRATDLGKSIYNNYCSACHEAGIGGAPRFGDTTTWNTLAKSGMQKLYAIAINGGGNMPAKGTCITCNNFEIELAVDYIVSASGQKQEDYTAQEPVPLSGAQIYQAHCSRCHDNTQTTAPQLGDRKAWQPIEANGFLQTYQNIVTGKKGHPDHGGCTKCTDKEIIAALKYMMQKGSTNKNYDLW